MCFSSNSKHLLIHAEEPPSLTEFTEKAGLGLDEAQAYPSVGRGGAGRISSEFTSVFPPAFGLAPRSLHSRRSWYNNSPFCLFLL